MKLSYNKQNKHYFITLTEEELNNLRASLYDAALYNTEKAEAFHKINDKDGEEAQWENVDTFDDMRNALKKISNK